MGVLELIQELQDQKLDYVIARAGVTKDVDAYTAIGISKSSFYKWEDREYLNELAQKLKRENATKAMIVFQDAAEEAAKEIVHIAQKSRSDSVRLSANAMIIERVAGKVSTPIDANIKNELTWKEFAEQQESDDLPT